MAKTINIAPSAPRKPKAKASTKPTYDQIQARAYEIFLRRCGAPGDQLQDWLQAESELASRRKSPSKSSKTVRPAKAQAA
jgi:hypothetical protein